MLGILNFVIVMLNIGLGLLNIVLGILAIVLGLGIDSWMLCRVAAVKSLPALIYSADYILLLVL